MLRNILLKMLLGKTRRAEYLAYPNQQQTIREYLQYLELKTHLPVSHIVKQNNIRKYAREHGYQILVETGTYLGDMVEAQKGSFRQLFSIELSEELYRKAAERFKKDSQVTILNGDSGMVLKKLLPDILEPALFWLDGHYSSGITAKGDVNTPIIEELKTIFGSAYRHGVLIDDARLFVGEDDYPTLNDLCALVTAHAPERTITVADDIIRIL